MIPRVRVLRSVVLLLVLALVGATSCYSNKNAYPTSPGAALELNSGDLGAGATYQHQFAAPAAAQWSRVLDVPQSPVYTVRVNGDTIAVGTSTTVFVSTNAGVSWKESTKPVANVGAVTAVLVLNGRLYAGTFGQGVFVSDD